MRARPALVASAVLALAGCGHTRSMEPTPPTTQTSTVTRTVRTTATATATVTQTVTTTPTPGAAPAPPAAPAHAPAPARRLVVGAVEDEAKFAPTDAAARAHMQRARRAGFRAIAFSAFWRPPLQSLPAIERDALRRAARAAVAESITPIVDVAQFGSETPLSEDEQADFAAFAASVARLVPQVEHVVVGNEPNTNLFWRPQFDGAGTDAAARAYERVLARSYDAIKDVSPTVEVIGGGLAARGADRPGGKRPTHSPSAFIRDLGSAYRESGRKRPLMDAFSMHVYGETSRTPPSRAHLGTSIGIADYEKLEALLHEALGRATPIVYGEYGVNTTVPPRELEAYSGSEAATKHPVDARTQARYYAQAIGLAACQPLVEMLLFFHVTDEPQLERFQTGMYYADKTPKPGLEKVAQAADAAFAGTIACPR
jgi:hypothetical protein